MPSDEPLSFIIKSKSLGTAGSFDPTVLARVRDKDPMHVSQIFLRATLDEMTKIRHLSRILGEDNRDLLQETGNTYYDLQDQMKDLQVLERRSWIYKLFKGRKIKNARETFVSDTFELWNATSTKSDKMKQVYLITPTADLSPVETGSVPSDQEVSGVAVDLPRGPITPEAFALAQDMVAALAGGDPFADPTPSGSQVGEASSTPNAITEAGVSLPSPNTRISVSGASPMNVNLAVVNNINSNTSGLAINNTYENSG